MTKIFYTFTSFLPILQLKYNFIDFNYILNLFHFDILDILSGGKISVIEDRLNNLKGQNIDINKNLDKISMDFNKVNNKINHLIDSSETLKIKSDNNADLNWYLTVGSLVLGSVLVIGCFFYFFNGNADNLSDNFKSLNDSISNTTVTTLNTFSQEFIKNNNIISEYIKVQCENVQNQNVSINERLLNGAIKEILLKQMVQLRVLNSIHRILIKMEANNLDSTADSSLQGLSGSIHGDQLNLNECVWND